MSSNRDASGSSQNPAWSTAGITYVPTRKNIITLATATAKTVTTAESGSHFMLPSVGAVITLPAPTIAGLQYDFSMLANNATTAWTLTSPTASTLTGLAIAGGAGGPPIPAQVLLITGSTSILFTAATALKGDTVSIVSNGTYWMLQARGLNDTVAESFSVA